MEVQLVTLTRNYSLFNKVYSKGTEFYASELYKTVQPPMDSTKIFSVEEGNLLGSIQGSWFEFAKGTLFVETEMAPAIFAKPPECPPPPPVRKITESLSGKPMEIESPPESTLVCPHCWRGNKWRKIGEGTYRPTCNQCHIYFQVDVDSLGKLTISK